MNKLFFSLSVLCVLTCPISLFAKSINLYEEPKDKAKIIGTLDSAVGIIPIYTPEKSAWIKVADPRNGNVGWVKNSDLGSSNSTEYTFTQKFINTGASPQTYQFIQFGSPTKMSPDQIQSILKSNQLQQEQLQKNINKMMNDMNQLFQWNSSWATPNVPFMVPVIVIPTQNPAPEKAKK